MLFIDIFFCDYLIVVFIFNVIMWYMVFFVFFGNVIVIIYIVFFLKKKVFIIYFILILNLSFVDLLMGVYFFIIVIVNLRYIGMYGLMDYVWRYSWLCILVGILVMVFSEMLVFMVFLIIVDCFLVIKYFILKICLMKRGVIGLCVFIWFILWFLVIFLLLIYENFYFKFGICILLLFFVFRKIGWRYLMMIFVGMNVMLFIGIFIG